jgi:hypothetical protein
MAVARVSLEVISRAFREQVQYYRAASENAVQLVAPQHKLTFPFQTSGVALFSKKKLRLAELIESSPTGGTWWVNCFEISSKLDCLLG